MSVIEWLRKQSIQRKMNIYGLIILIAGAIPVFYFLGIPLTITYTTQSFYDALNDVPEGGVVVFGFQVMKLEAYKGKEDVMRAIMSVVHSRGVKAVCLSLGAIAPLIFEDIYERNNLEEVFNLEYGVDYLITPFVSGEETAMAAFAADTWATIATDLFGTPVQNLPLMQEVRSATDVDLWWFASYSAGNIDQAVRQWGWAYNQPIVMCFQSYASAAYAYPWPMVGVLDGIRGEAEFEFMSGYPGAELARYEGQSTQGITMLVTLAIGFIYYNTIGKTMLREERKEYDSGGARSG